MLRLPGRHARQSRGRRAPPTWSLSPKHAFFSCPLLFEHVSSSSTSLYLILIPEGKGGVPHKKKKTIMCMWSIRCLCVSVGVSTISTNELNPRNADERQGEREKNETIGILQASRSCLWMMLLDRRAALIAYHSLLRFFSFDSNPVRTKQLEFRS